MSNRIISLNISDAYISAIGGSIGATGSGNATTLRMTFDEHWDGTTKTVYFKDANGANPVSVVVGVDTLVSGTTYDINVPPITLATAGMASMSVRGVILNADDRSKVDKSITTQAVWFKVLDSDITWTGGVILATDKEQLQAEIDALTTVFTSSKAAAETAATTATTRAGEAAASATAAAKSANTADEKATSAAGSAASVASSAATAATKASEASVSATAASDSATSAASSAARAESAKNSAETAQSAAKSSATDAASSAASAMASAGNAAASATNASNSASAATAAASAAQTAKTAAETASENAQSFKTKAAQSASEAAASAAQAAAIVGGDFATHKDVGTAKDEAISTAATALAAHTGNTSNPHGVTSAQIGAQPVLTAGTNITISGNTISATGGLYPRIVVTAPTGATVTCHRDSVTLTAIENRGTWTFDVPDYGTWTITATLGANTAEDAVVVSAVQLYNVTLAYIDDTFANNTWQAIRSVVDSGTIPAGWNVGDFKPITLNGTMGTVALNNFQCSLQIVAKPGFNSTKEGSNIMHLRFASADGTKGLAFCDSGYGTATSNASKFNMNPTNVNTGGFWASTMNTGILGNTGTPAAPTANSLMSCLPQEVRDVMVQCTKYNDNTGGGADTAAFVTAKQYWIALPAEFEVFGARTYANSAEQTYQQQYPFFATGNSKIHYRHDALTTAVGAWERSVFATGTDSFGRVYTGGTAGASGAYISYGVPPLLFI